MFTPQPGTTQRSVLRCRRLIDYLHLILLRLRTPSFLLALYSFPSHITYVPAFDPSTPRPITLVPFLGVLGARLPLPPPPAIAKTNTPQCLFALVGDVNEFSIAYLYGTDDNIFRYSLLSPYDEVASLLYLVATLLVVSHQRAALQDDRLTHDSLADAKRRACLTLLIANTLGHTYLPPSRTTPS
jgi:hypothetical protein